MSDDRIWDLIKEIDKKLDDLCGRMMKVEINQKNHYKDLDRKQNNKDKRLYLIIAGMGVSFTIITYVQGMI